MTREEIISKGRPIEPYCFETDREEQWYNVGLYDGATENPWHSVADGDLPKLDTIVLINTKEYGVITARYDKGWVGVEVPLFYSADIARTADEVDYWMEIPQLPKESEVNK